MTTPQLSPEELDRLITALVQVETLAAQGRAAEGRTLLLSASKAAIRTAQPCMWAELACIWEMALTGYRERYGWN